MRWRLGCWASVVGEVLDRLAPDLADLFVGGDNDGVLLVVGALSDEMSVVIDAAVRSHDNAGLFFGSVGCELATASHEDGDEVLVVGGHVRSCFRFADSAAFDKLGVVAVGNLGRVGVTDSSAGVGLGEWAGREVDGF